MRNLVTASLAALCTLGGCIEEGLPYVDGGSDAGAADACATPVDCAAPPPDCHYEGGDFCTSCGRLVCEGDAGMTELDGAADPALDAASDAAHDGGTDAASEVDAGAFTCGAKPFPTIARNCSQSDDCLVVEHQINCCGTLRALGIRADARAQFEAAEGPCRDSYPLCGCASQQTRADDDTIDDGTQGVRVECVAGLCTSTFAPAGPRACTPGGAACGPGYSCCYPCGIEGCEFQCEPTCSPGTPACAGGCLLRP